MIYYLLKIHLDTQTKFIISKRSLLKIYFEVINSLGSLLLDIFLIAIIILKMGGRLYNKWL